MEAMGFGPDAVARMRARAAACDQDEGLAVHPDNETAVRWFLTVASQWRQVALPAGDRVIIRRTGLDYPAAEAAARMAGLSPDAGDFTRLRIMESAALAAWNEAA